MHFGRPTHYARSTAVSQSKLFLSIFPEEFIFKIVECTNARIDSPSHQIEVSDLYKFLGLIIIAGIYKSGV